VAGVVALLEQATNGKLTPDAALAAITRSARPMPGYAEWEVGAGYLDAYAAILEAQKSSTSTVTLSSPLRR
jgi:serine protease AprX